MDKLDTRSETVKKTVEITLEIEEENIAQAVSPLDLEEDLW